MFLMSCLHSYKILFHAILDFADRVLLLFQMQQNTKTKHDREMRMQLYAKCWYSDAPPIGDLFQDFLDMLDINSQILCLNSFLK